jgi:hypothetical protein
MFLAGFWVRKKHGVKVAPAPVASEGETVIPTYSIKITTSIMVTFSLVTGLWAAWTLDHSVYPSSPYAETKMTIARTRNSQIVLYSTNLVPLGHAMAQVVSRRPLTEEAQVHARVNPCGICGGQSGTGTGFSPSSSVFLVALQTHII